MDITKWGGAENVQFFDDYTKAIVTDFISLKPKVSNDFKTNVNFESESNVNKEKKVFKYHIIINETSLTVDYKLEEKYLTMDLETRTINDVMNPISVSWYDGKNSHSNYVTDFISSDEMLERAILDLMIRKYSGYRVYLHNFSQFDSIFLLRILSNLSEYIKPIIRDGRIINLRVKYGEAKNKMSKV